MSEFGPSPSPLFAKDALSIGICSYHLLLHQVSPLCPIKKKKKKKKSLPYGLYFVSHVKIKSNLV